VRLSGERRQLHVHSTLIPSSLCANLAVCHQQGPAHAGAATSAQADLARMRCAYWSGLR